MNTHDLIQRIPTSRQLRRAIRHSPYLPGRPAVGEDPRFWVGLLLGAGVAATATALFNPRRGSELRARLRSGAGRLSALRGNGRVEHANVGPPSSTVEESIELAVPVERAYRAWTRFENLPRFMDGVLEVRRNPSNRRELHWKAVVGGREQEWDAVITEETENQRVAWRSVAGAHNAGVVTFHHLDPDHCKVMLQMEYEPEGALERVGDRLGVLQRRVQGDLERFREHMEESGVGAATH